MTQPEIPESLGFPDESVERPFPTRRELRAQREAKERAAAAQPAEAPAVAVEVATDWDSMLAALPVMDAAAPIEIGAIPVVADVEPTVAPAAAAAVEAEYLAAVAPRRGRASATRPPREPRSAQASQRLRLLRKRISAIGTMVVIGGIFASLTLPAYAQGNANSATVIAAQTGSQKYAVGNKIDGVAVSRDAYGATTQADLRANYSSSLAATNLAAYLKSGAKELGDDYPWPAALDRSQGGGLSPLRYYYRECVDFVAWRLNRDAGYTSAPYYWNWSTLTPGGGDASAWKSDWIAKGWPTSSTPVPGSVAWFAGDHVAYVDAVLGNGQVLLEEYNYNSDHQYDQRIVDASDVGLFLYPPPTT